MSITAFPVLARILEERGLSKDASGQHGNHVRGPVDERDSVEHSGLCGGYCACG